MLKKHSGNIPRGVRSFPADHLRSAAGNFNWLLPEWRPIVVAHRGSSAAAPENTLAAFRQAVEDGADAVELDVHLSGDGEVVVIHDARLTRTTNGRGWVSRHTLAELKRLDAGKWFHRRFEGERIPTLSEVLGELNGRVGVNIEIKGSRTQHRYDIVERCMRVVRKHRAARYVLISSFHHPYVRRAKILEPSVAAGVLFHPVRHLQRSPSALASAAGADFFICGGRFLQGSMIRDIRRHDLHLGLYTINTIKQLEKAVRIGADSLVSDCPAKILGYIGRCQGG